MIQEEQIPIEKSKIVDKHQFYFETAIYRRISSAELEDKIFEGEFFGYNPIKKFQTTYTVQKAGLAYQGRSGTYDGISGQLERGREKFWDASLEGVYAVVLTCKQSHDQIIYFLSIDKESVTKIGQQPSLADIQYAEIGKRYDKYLSKIDLKNYKKAIGLYAHSAGAGSFVYLRRIFENLIFETFELHKDALTIDPVDFKQKRMEEKVEVLRAHLPSQLVEMKSIYGILSKGVHELSEEECLRYFSPIRLSIELVLDQKIEAAQKSERDRLVKLELQKIHKELGGGEK